MSFTKINFDVTIGIENPNDLEISLLNTNYEVWIKESIVASGQKSDKIQIPALQKTSVTLPVEIEIMSFLDVLKVYLSGKTELNVNLRGKTSFDSPIGAIDIEINEFRSLKPKK